jgi:DNA-binding transcriptional LysR family regulator
VSVAAPVELGAALRSDSVPGAPTRWLAVRPQQLLTFEAVAGTRSFTAAARALGYSQSAISQQIAALEGAAGVALIARSGAIEPTAAGEVLLRRARAIRQQFVALESELLALEAGSSDVLVVQSHHPAAASFLADVVHPAACDVGQRLVVDVAQSRAALVHALQAAICELAVAAMPPVVDAELVVEPLFEAPLELVSRHSASHCDEPAAVAELAGVQLLCLATCPATEHLLRELRERKISHDVCVRSDDPGLLLRLVRRGLGSAVLPRTCLDHVERELVRVPLDERFTVCVSAVWCADRPPAGPSRTILDLARAAAARRRKRS